jgi:hypothetical protein
MKIRIPKNREQLRQHLHDPLFANAYFLMGIANAYFLMGNTLLSANFLRKNLVKPSDVRFAQSDYALRSISAAGLLSHVLAARVRHRADQVSSSRE